MKRLFAAARYPLTVNDSSGNRFAFAGSGRRAADSGQRPEGEDPTMTQSIIIKNRDLLPPKDQLMAEFDSGRVPRSATWHTLITGLYYNFDGVNGMAEMYKMMEELTTNNQQWAEDIGQQHGEIEIWHGEVDTWQQEAKAAANRAQDIADNLGTGTAQPFSICVNFSGHIPESSELVFSKMKLPVNGVFPAGIPRSSAFCTYRVNDDFTINFIKNGQPVGNLNFTPEYEEGIFTWRNDVTFTPDDILLIRSAPGQAKDIMSLSLVLNGLRSVGNG